MVEDYQFHHYAYIYFVVRSIWLNWFFQIGGKRVEAAAQKGNTYSLGLLFGKKKSSWSRLLDQMELLSLNQFDTPKKKNDILFLSFYVSSAKLGNQ